VARYNSPANGVPSKKTFMPFSWDGEGWVNKSPPSPRPLYGLELLAARPTAAVLVCEGEKATDAARDLLGDYYVCVSWPNGSNSWNKADWSPLYGRKLLLWPDNDSAGIKAMSDIAALLSPHCPEIKLVNVADLPPGHDLADCSTWNTEQVIEWAKARVTLYTAPVVPKDWVSPAVIVTGETIYVPEPLPEPPSYVTEEVPPPQPKTSVVPWDKLKLSFNKDGALIVNTSNTVEILEHLEEFKNTIWHDEFYHRTFTEEKGEVTPWEDISELKLLIKLQAEPYKLTRLVDKTVNQAVNIIAKRNVRNEPKAYFQSVTWDGVPRVRSFFKDCFGSLDPENYLSAISKNFWVSIIARVMQPGCKADHMVILVGEQGSFKSTALSIIGGKWFSELHNGFDSKEFAKEIQASFLIEVSELGALNKTNIESTKGKLSATFDRDRGLYNKFYKDLPRQCIFAGTTNDYEFLKDITGNRRFWPVKVEKTQLDYIKENRDQLFAEAMALYLAGENWHEVPLEETLKQQENYTEAPLWADDIDRWVGKGTTPRTEFTLMALLNDCLNISAGQKKCIDERNAAKALRWLGFKNCFDNSSGKCARVWRKG